MLKKSLNVSQYPRRKHYHWQFKGPFTPSENKRESEKKIKEQGKEIKEKMQTSKRIFAFALARCEQASRIVQIITVALKRVTVPAKQRTERARPCRHLSCLSVGLWRERQRKQWSLRWTRRSHWSIYRREFIYIMYKSLKSRAEGSFTLRKSEPKEERFVNWY